MMKVDVTSNIELATLVKERKNFSTSRLHEINLYNQKLGDEAILHLFQVLKENQTKNISLLNLGFNELTSRIAKPLCSFIRRNSNSLCYLWLHGNQLKDEGVQLLCETIKSCPYAYNIQDIDLLENQIGDKGMRCLSEVLKLSSFSSLRTLNLGVNKIGDEGVKALGEALKLNKTLLWLSLFSNDFGDQGVRSLAEGLERNNILQHLNIRDTKHLTTSGVKELINRIRMSNNSTLRFATVMSLVETNMQDQEQELQSLLWYTIRTDRESVSILLLR